jgi:excisionase family DNA binding protein
MPDHDPIIVTTDAESATLPNAATDPDGAVKYLGLSRTLIYRLMASGEIRNAKIGRRRIVKYSDLDAFYEAHVAKAAS